MTNSAFRGQRLLALSQECTFLITWLSAGMDLSTGMDLTDLSLLLFSMLVFGLLVESPQHLVIEACYVTVPTEVSQRPPFDSSIRARSFEIAQMAMVFWEPLESGGHESPPQSDFHQRVSGGPLWVGRKTKEAAKRKPFAK